MNLKWIIPVLAVAQLAAPISARAPKPWTPHSIITQNASGCWVAECFIDGYSLHWQQSFSTFAEADEARAEHARDNGDRHQTIVDSCE